MTQQQQRQKQQYPATYSSSSSTTFENASPIRQRSTQEKEERYEILPSASIFERLQKLVENYPSFATLTTTQEWFGLPRAGSSNDCPFDENYRVNGDGCNNYVLIIQDKEAYPEDPDVRLDDNSDYYINLEDGWFKKDNKGGRSGWKYVPDVFLSGSVHGNERVGPTSLLEMSELLVEAAYCESLPRMRYKPQEALLENGGSTNNANATTSNTNGNAEEEVRKWNQELAAAQTCRQSLATQHGIPSPYRQWLARLVSTRRIVIIPTANALGYFRDNRAEGNIDPNRDFPFDVEDPADCMQTIAGRSINELFRSHLFPIGLTFHGGMEVIGYEWGAPTYLHKDAPDAIAQNDIASAYSRYANGFHGHVPYDYGTMNDKVYYVRGGMEDWAFAGSWDPERVIPCEPKTFGGYPAAKTKYNNSTLRAFNMLVETSDPKTPPRDALGKRNQPLVSSNGEDNGHIARNIRLALLAIDVVEPYVSIRGVSDLTLEDDVVPGVNARRYKGMSYFENSMVVWVPLGSPESSAPTKVSWTVGGAFNIDTTELVLGPWDTLPTNLADANDGTYPSMETMATINSSDEFVTLNPTNIDSKAQIAGRSRWHADGPHPLASNNGFVDLTFEAEIDTSAYSPGTKLAIFARAKVDENWLAPANNVGPQGLGPASHIVNARRNPSYFATNAGKVIRGKADDWWYSVPITLVVGAAGGPDEEAQVLDEAEINNTPRSVDESSQIVRAVHLNARIGFLPHAMESVSRGSGSMEQSLPWLLGPLSVLVFALLGIVVLVRWRRRRLYAQRELERISEEEDSFSVGSYRDDPAEDEEAVDAGANAEDEG